MRNCSWLFSLLARQAIMRRFREHVIGNGVFLEKAFEFLHPINRAIGCTAGANQPALCEPVKRGRTDTNRLGRLDAS